MPTVATVTSAAVDPAAAPVADAERLQTLDLLRGVALLGILLVNISWFAMPNALSANPYAVGPPPPMDLAIWLAIELLAEGKFIAIFAMLFGAGIVLMTGRRDAGGVHTARTHYRRMACLLVFGLIHAYALWHGDILVVYAVCGLLVYPLRRLTTRPLMAIGLALMTIAMLTSIAEAIAWPASSDLAKAEWVEYWQPSAGSLATETAAFTGRWSSQEAWRAHYSAAFHLDDMAAFDLWRVSGLMLIGMALLKCGWFGGTRTAREYRLATASALVSGFTLVGVGLYEYQAVHWRLPDVLFLIPLWNYWDGLLVALGYTGVLLMLWRAGVLRHVSRRLEDVGRTAFSGYIFQTLICTTIFYGHGLGLFGTIDRAGQLLLTLAIWLVLLIVSPLWLRGHRYGPLEWLWRTLTYGRVPRAALRP
jgi:uncharacterized protein